MKHNPVAIEYGDLMERITDEQIKTMDTDSGPDVPAALPHASWYVVMWPEHVQTPRYNDDCTVHGPMNKQEAMEYRDGVVLYGARCFKE